MSNGLMSVWMFGVVLAAVMVFILIDVWKKKK